MQTFKMILMVVVIIELLFCCYSNTKLIRCTCKLYVVHNTIDLLIEVHCTVQKLSDSLSKRCNFIFSFHDFVIYGNLFQVFKTFMVNSSLWISKMLCKIIHTAMTVGILLMCVSFLVSGHLHHPFSFPKALSVTTLA